ncbi:MAG: hypothetical protein JAY74_23665 [Candidatus Thiodiazotropha taylori]|nr:hypothetical protein [Candidatus Thiodiazotropha taylori]
MSENTNTQPEIMMASDDKSYVGVTRFDEDFSLEATTEVESAIIFDDLILIQGKTVFKDKSEDGKEETFEGRTFLREIVINGGEVALMGTTYITDVAHPSEGRTTIKVPQFLKISLIEKNDVYGCIL